MGWLSSRREGAESRRRVSALKRAGPLCSMNAPDPQVADCFLSRLVFAANSSSFSLVLYDRPYMH